MRATPVAGGPPTQDTPECNRKPALLGPAPGSQAAGRRARPDVADSFDKCAFTRQELFPAE